MQENSRYANGQKRPKRQRFLLAGLYSHLKRLQESWRRFDSPNAEKRFVKRVCGLSQQLQRQQQLEFREASECDGELEVRGGERCDFAIVCEGCGEGERVDEAMDGIAEGKEMRGVVEWREVY